MNPSTSLGTRSNAGIANPSPAVRQAGNIRSLLMIRGVYRRSLPSACTHVKYRCRCRGKGLQLFENYDAFMVTGQQNKISCNQEGILAMSIGFSGLDTPCCVQP